MQANIAVDVKDIVKTYGTKVAVDGLTFSFYEGQFVGLLGPNGAGKTTTINMLTGLMKPTSGSVLYFSRDFLKNSIEAKSYIGVVPQANNLDRDLTAYENLYQHGLLYKIPKKTVKTKISKLLDFAGLVEYRDKLVKTFSGGTKRRLVIIRALLHEPKILFLDEPTVGLDPQIRRDIWDFIIKINQSHKTTILMTTHYIEEAERLCERVMIINNGKLIADGSPDDLKSTVGAYVLEIYTMERIEELFFDDRQSAVDTLKRCTKPCKVREATLEDVFLKITGRRIDA
ncbi:MAG: ABC transporter ATP-binding protein [Candidatus Magnetoovum sp. WYHC-5]|nr:ABC transporter ATP-binding protein [Candidatus Magnetoovum sp. WYHC-5]